MKIEKDEITIRDFTETDLPLMFKWLTDKRVLADGISTVDSSLLRWDVRGYNMPSSKENML